MQRLLRSIEMRDELMAEEIEVDPLVRAATFGATEHATVEIARGLQIVDRDCEVKRLERHCRSMPPGLREALAQSASGKFS